MAQNALLGASNDLWFCRWIVLINAAAFQGSSMRQCTSWLTLSPPVMARSRRLPLLLISHYLGYLLTL
jgi:hypothetical protein